MTVPIEYSKANLKFYEFLVDARDTAGLWSTHVTYTMAQGVFQVFRRRISNQQAIAFANILPICLRALFVTDWDLDDEKKRFEDRETMVLEVRQLRSAHNFSTDNAIRDVAQALRRHVDVESLDELLKQMPEGAIDFWAL